MWHEKISEAIEIGLRRKKISQVDLASKIGVTESAVSSWTKGRKLPSADKLMQIIAILDLVPDLFPGYSATRDPPTITPEMPEKIGSPALQGEVSDVAEDQEARADIKRLEENVQLLSENLRQLQIAVNGILHAMKT